MWQLLAGAFQGAQQGEASAESAKLQAEAALYGAEKSAQTQEEMFDVGQAATAPWREKGAEALDTIRVYIEIKRRIEQHQDAHARQEQMATFKKRRFITLPQIYIMKAIFYCMVTLASAYIARAIL